MRSWRRAEGQREQVDELVVRVECYAGYKGDERPLRVHLGAGALEVVNVEDRWYSPGTTYFRIVVEGGDRYVLRREEAQDIWSLSAFRAETNRARTR
jgi:hypothetical protein